MPAKTQPPPNPLDDQEEKREEETTADDVFDNNNNEESKNKQLFETKIKTQDDDEMTDTRNASANLTSRKRHLASIPTSEEKKQNE